MDPTPPSTTSRTSVFASGHLWRVWLLLLLVIAVAAGSYAIRTAFVQYSLGPISPDGSRFVVYRYIHTSQHLEFQSAICETQTGRVVCDLAEFEPTNPRWQWAPDGKSVVSVVETHAASQSTVVQVDVRGLRGRVMREVSFAGNIRFYAVLNDGSLVCMTHHRGSFVVTEEGKEIASRPYFRLVGENNVEIARIEHGMDEGAFVRGFPDDRNIVGVSTSANRSKPKGDYLWTASATPKHTQLLQFDLRTGALLRQIELSPRFNGRVFQTSKYAIADVDGVASLVSLDDPRTAIVPATGRDTPLMVDDERAVLLDRNSVRVFTRSDQTGIPLHKVSRVQDAFSDGRGRVLCVTYDGRLLRFDPKTGQAETLADHQKWMSTARTLAILCFVGFPLAWLLIASRNTSLPAFAESCLGIALFIGACMLAWRIGMPLCEARQIVLGFQIYVAVASLLPLMVVWGSTFDSKRGRLLSIAVVIAACLLFAIIVTPGQSKTFQARLPEFAVAAGLLLIGNFCVFAILRWMLGSVVRAGTTSSQKQTSFSIRELVAMTAGFASIFACWRLTDLKSDEYLGATTWLCSVVALNCVVVGSSVAAVFYFRHTLIAFVAWFVLTLLLVALHWAVASQLGVDMNDVDRLQWYPLTLLSGLLVFIAIRFVRGQGYALVRKYSYADEN